MVKIISVQKSSYEELLWDQVVMETVDFENVNVLVKPFTSDWDLNSCWDSNPAKTLPGTLMHNILIRTTSLVSGLTEAQVLGFWLPHHRKSSVRDRVIAEKWIYLERNTLHRQSVGHRRRRKQPETPILRPPEAKN